MNNNKFFDVSLFVFCSLLSVSCISGLFVDYSSPPIIGMLALIWAIMGLFMTLWVIERAFYYKRKVDNSQKSNLSSELIHSMQRRKVFNQGMKGMRSFNNNVIGVFLLGMLYIFYSLWISFLPQDAQSLNKLNSEIQTYFNLVGEEIFLTQNFFTFFMLILQFSGLLITAIVFWLSQIFVYANSETRQILWLCVSIFILSFIFLTNTNIPFWEPQNLSILQIGYGWSHIELLQNLGLLKNEPLSYFQQRLFAVGVIGVFLFYLPCILIGIFIFKEFFSKSGNFIYPLLGFLVLAGLFYADLFFKGSLALLPLWMSGWSALGVICTRHHSGYRKIYRIYNWN